ncbi:MAG: IS3 family transposase, partial [Campylobacterales bacterium]|nr:IS3 family transposase [Campylobacterales bacterium]
AQANRSIFEYIEVFYNRQRLHSANYNLAPVDFEKKMMKITNKEKMLLMETVV